MTDAGQRHAEPEKPRKLTARELIDQTARTTAEEMERRYRRHVNTNYYRATERLLRAYPKLKRIHDHPEEYGFLPIGKSKSISVAPLPGSGVRDPIEALEEHIENRAASYDRTVARFTEIDAVVRQFAERPEFIVIRMYYFGEDAYGNDRGADARRYTFEDIASELSIIGVEASEKSLRIWRARLVQDMTVLLFGAEGAVSIEARSESPWDSEFRLKAETADGSSLRAETPRRREPKQGRPKEGG